MKKLRSLIFSNHYLDALKKQQLAYHEQKVHWLPASLLLVVHGLWWFLFRPEGKAWHRLLKNKGTYFPNHSFRKASLSNLIRYPIQAVWLCIFKPYTPQTHRLKHLWLRIKKFKKQCHKNTLPCLIYLKKKLTGFTQSLVPKHATFLNHPMILTLVLAASIFILLVSISRYFSTKEQIFFFIILWLVALMIKNATGKLSLLTLVLMSVLASCRYLWWRYSTTLVWFDLQSQIFGVLLILAETYVACVLILGYFQSIWPLNRQPVSLPKNPTHWPSVDVMITTYNESLDIVKLGIYAALGMDWPKDKLNIYLLDDGDRPEFKKFAQEVNVHYIARKTNEHAKAGNINHALAKTSGEYIAFFDCDFITTRAFLQLTMGWFLKDKKMAFIQTPHHFFSEDPFEKNLSPSHNVPNESHLFYDVVQNGNDTWNATYFCGSSGVFRRSAMEAIGGMATQSVTEDALTSLKLHQLGYHSAYLRIPLAAGLATDSISVHIGQRIRWARGMVQILRLERPIINRKLTIAQRLCYFSAILHFLSGLPRLVFLTIPFAYLVCNANIFFATPLMVFLYISPHLLHAVLANSKIQGEHRHFLWNELYETIMSYYITLPAISALINPKSGSFNVTSKGGLIKDKFADWKVAAPYLFILSINLIALFVGIVKLAFFQPESALTVVLNLFWVFYNLTILGGVLGVIIEERQVRAFPRVSCQIDAMLKFNNGHLYPCQLTDYSAHGMNVQPTPHLLIHKKEDVELILKRDNAEYAFQCTVRREGLNSIGLELKPLSHQQYIHFMQCTFSRADTWSKYRASFKKQSPMNSIIAILKLSRVGYYEAIRFAPPIVQRIIKIFANCAIFIFSFLPRFPTSPTQQ